MTDVSVIMSVYNELPERLTRAINSVFTDEKVKIELIVMNDCSSKPEVAEILDKVSSENNKIKYILNDQNLGLTKSLNKGLKEAKGKYIARLDSDDFNISGRLTTQFEFLESNPDYVFCGTKHNVLIEDRLFKQMVPFVSEDHEIRNVFSLFNPFAHSTLMFRKDSLEKVNGYNESYRYAQDYRLALDLLRLGKAKNLEEILVTRNEDGNQISQKNYKAQLLNSLKTSVLSQIYIRPSFLAFINQIKSLTILLLPMFIIKKIKKRRRIRGISHKLFKILNSDKKD